MRSVIYLTILLLIGCSDRSNTADINSIPSSASAVQTKVSLDPYGQHWPISAGYVGGDSLQNQSGLSSVTIDNSNNSSNVFVKLYDMDIVVPIAVRAFYIPSRSRFELGNVDAGSYEIRYQDLDDGTFSKSEKFNLEEISTAQGTQYSQLTMTLYKVADGNMQTYPISQSEF